MNRSASTWFAWMVQDIARIPVNRMSIRGTAVGLDQQNEVAMRPEESRLLPKSLLERRKGSQKRVIFLDYGGTLVRGVKRHYE